MGEHLFLSATECDSWTNFVREIESIEHAKKPITAPTPMEIDAYQGNCLKCRKNVGVRAMEVQRSLNAHNVERKIMDSVGHGATHRLTKIHRKEDGKETEKETAREPKRWKVQRRKRRIPRERKR